MKIEMLRNYRRNKRLKEHLRNGNENEFHIVSTEVQDVEDYIRNIQDDMTRNIFTMVYVDGMLHKEVGKKLGYTRAGITTRIHQQLMEDSPG